MEWLEKNEVSSDTYVCPEDESGSDRWCTIDEGGLDVLIAEETAEENAWVNMEANVEENAEENAGENAGPVVDGWHLLMDGGEVVGPYVMDDLIQWYYDGAVDGSVQVHGGHDWMLLSEAVAEEGEEVGESEVYLLDGSTNETNGARKIFFLFFFFSFFFFFFLI